MNIYHYVYQISNKLNGHVYVGVRKSKVAPEKDIKYMGSGKAIKDAILKYGRGNFEKTIISLHATWQAALSAEAEIVTSEFVLREDTYNLTLGGFGGSVKGHKKSDEFKRKISKAKKGQPCARKGKTQSDDTRQRISESNRGRQFSEEHKDNLKKARARRTELMPVTDETKRKISKALSGRARPEEVKKKISDTKRRKALESKLPQ